MNLVEALKQGKVAYTGNSANNVKIELGNGNAEISVRGNNVDIKTGVGNQTVGVLGNDVSVKLDQNAPIDWDSSKDFDQVGVVSNSGKTTINTGDGNDTAVAVANNVDIKMGKGNHVAIYYGDNVKINMGDADQNVIFSADKAFGNQTIDEKTSIAGINVGDAAARAIEDKTKLVVNSWTEYNKTDKASFMNAIKDSYKLDDANMKVLEELYDSGALFETFTDKNTGKTYPRYSIMKSVKQTNANGSDKNILCYNDYTVNNGQGMHTRGLIETSKANYGTLHKVGGKTYGFAECVATKIAGQNSYKIDETVTKYTEQYYQLDGTKNLDVKVGKSNTTIVDVTATGKVNISGKDASLKSGQGYSINVDAAVKTTVTDIKKEVVKTGRKQTISWMINNQNAGTYTSPLVLDMNKDGKVSAASGEGVDVDGNGVGDGYATGGDKMLAMTDMNGNGEIDGAEVFGNKTVDPFTGKAINAANGFEALKVVAQSAEKATGISCYKNGQVDLNALKTALATKGYNLGYISDANTKDLEALENYDVAAITVDAYEENDKAEGSVQHRQQGTYTTADGQTYSVDDVWFKDRSKMDKMLDNLK